MGYNFARTKAADIYIESLGHIVTLPKNNNTKLLLQTAAKELTAMNELIAVVRGEMTRLAKELPEYETVHAMYGVGDTPAARVNPKFCVNSISGANRAKFICGGSRLVRLPPW